MGSEFDEAERKDKGTSFPENAFAFYLYESGLDIVQDMRPDWLNSKGKENGKINKNYNRELDIYIPNLNIGIEYDGKKWHQNLEKDLEKDELAKNDHSTEIIHIREAGCPEMPEDSLFIKRDKYEVEDSLKNSIIECFTLLNERYGLDLDLNIIDPVRDNEKIKNYMAKVMNTKFNKSTGFLRNHDDTITYAA